MPESRVTLRSESELAGLALALAGTRRAALSAAERALVALSPAVPAALVALTRRRIELAEDPLGEAFCALRSAAERRPSGAVYTPARIVATMLERASRDEPSRVVDAGSGSGRFLLEAARRFPEAELVAIETDPLAALTLRANVTVLGHAERTRIVTDDYRTLRMARNSARTLFVGNPPYVRHHAISARWKRWLTAQAGKLGLKASQLAGLHAHFLLATAVHAAPGDTGVLVTSAEWLDVRYGALVRELLLGRLGLVEIHLLEPSTRPFEDAETTAVILRFEVDTFPASIRLRNVRTLDALAPLRGGHAVPREELAAASRWTALVRETSLASRAARTRSEATDPELGAYFDVHRGQVTGKNEVWIGGEHSAELPRSVLFPSVTKARELIRAGAALTSLAELRDVIDLPRELDLLDIAERRSVERFLRVARRMGAHQGFIASHRKAWWSVGLRESAPILVTYMARRAPAFVHNVAGARHLNIAHGLYPRAPLPSDALARIARHLSAHTPQSGGRTYAGGLTKFEPGELLRLRVRDLAELVHGSPGTSSGAAAGQSAGAGFGDEKSTRKYG